MTTTTTPSRTIDWQHDLEAALAQAHRASDSRELAVLLDFSAAPM